MKNVSNFVNDVPRVPTCVQMWGSTPKHFLMGSQMKLWTLGDKMGVLEVIGWDIPIFYKRCTKFYKECTKGSKMHSEVGINPQSHLYGFPNEIMNHLCTNGSLESNRIGCTKICEACTRFYERCTKGSKVHFEVGIDH